MRLLSLELFTKSWQKPAKVVVLLLGLVLSSCTGSSLAAVHLMPERALSWKDFLGVNAHFLWFTPEAYEQQIEQFKALGLQWVRVDVHWDRHETAAGRYRLAELDKLVETMDRHQLKSVVYAVGSAPHATSAPRNSATPDQYPPKDARTFAKFMYLLAQRYPQVTAWQVWNEPNLPAYWRPAEDPKAYGELLLSTTQALRQAAPNKDVVMAGMAYYSQMPVEGGLMFEALGQLGVQNLNTVAAYHPYTQRPEGNTAREPDFLQHASQLNNLLRSGNIKKIWATEWGWSSYAGPKEEQPIIGQDGQADYVLRRLALMSALDFDRVFLFALSDLDDRATVRDRGYGLLDLQGQPKQVYRALKRFLDITGPRLLPGQDLEFSEQPKDLYSVSWQRADGKNLLMFWSASQQPMALQGISAARLHKPLTGARQELTANGQQLKVPTSQQLQILEW